jgi:hypothetical protein
MGSNIPSAYVPAAGDVLSSWLQFRVSPSLRLWFSRRSRSLLLRAGATSKLEASIDDNGLDDVVCPGILSYAGG